ncbi:sensor histidine kinase [Capillimicrobium parvum]|uniref:histidine kinase n=1 Tax=Capillimicrobium parvum TaxID=2884022 RepID=A0A9E6Y214_9ACTN|nr:HAMP domain-containing sensor histidine kinase [Capillimicrobium parvum]UGS38328.1 Adaptive-response sensory-kinase SasA [Capillimicrobium parvum]
MMASLRARLIAGVLVLAAIGLLTAGAITYAEQRSFLLERVDGQARAATGAVSRALAEQGYGSPRPGAGFPGDRDGDHRPGGPPPTNLPPGTYGQLRAGDGTVLGATTLSYGQAGLPAPDLPKQLPNGRLVTVDAKGGSGLRYRVLSESDPIDGGSVVVAIPLRDVDQTLGRLLLVLALVIGAVLLALALLSWWVVRMGLRPLDRIGATAGAIAAGDLSRRVQPADSRTEVGRLGLSLNAMLERLERAFAERQASEDRLRRFLADASHELRTPLSSIRGYAEVFRMGAARDPGDVDKAMRRIEDESARMGVLVEDLLTLARLDELPEAVRAEVDLAAIAGDAASDAQAVAPDRAIAVGGDAPVIVHGDPSALRQVLANLLRNALVHTPAGTPIELTVGAGDGEATVAVRDHGPGLPPGDPHQLFERFWRAEGARGRERGKAGAGLGLAIVAGIVDAHGGRVTAEDAPGGGARFVVTLPAGAVAAPVLSATSQPIP